MANDIAEDPLFADDDLDDFDGHLQKRSPGIDSGLPVGSLGGAIPDHDLENTPRPKGSGVDRGAYESAIFMLDSLPDRIPRKNNGSERNSVLISAL